MYHARMLPRKENPLLAFLSNYPHFVRDSKHEGCQKQAMLSLALIIGGSTINLCGVILYCVEMFKGKAKPNRVTDSLWLVEGLIAFFAAFSDGVSWKALFPVATTAVLGPFAVLVLSFVLKQAYWAITAFDVACGVLSVVALGLWYITGDPAVAIFFAILADFSAALPTILKTWRYPETEALAGYALPTFGYATSLFALESYSFVEIAFPAWCVFICAFISVLIVVRKRRKTTA